MYIDTKHIFWRLAGVFTSLLVLFWATGCGGGSDETVRSPLQQQFLQQVQRSCEAELKTFAKSITNLQISPAETQDSLWDHLPFLPFGEAADGSDSLQCSLYPELEWATKFDAADPALAAYFETREQGDTLIARLREGVRTKTELQAQKVLHRNGQIVYLASRLQKENWLYALNVEVEVFFHDNGLYHHHRLTVQNEVSFIRSGFHALISGQVSYDE